jgi:hypothetical protein
LVIWSRNLSAAEALADYDLSRQGYPEVLNRVPFLSLAAASAPASTIFRRTLLARAGSRGSLN